MAPQLPQNFVAARRIVAAFVAAPFPLTFKPLRPFGNLPSTFPQIVEKCCETQVGGILPMGSVRCPPRRRTSLYSLGADEISGPPTWRGLSGKGPAPGVPLRPTINCCRATGLRCRSHRLWNGNMCFKGFAQKFVDLCFLWQRAEEQAVAVVGRFVATALCHKTIVAGTRCAPAFLTGAQRWERWESDGAVSPGRSRGCPAAGYLPGAAACARMRPVGRAISA
jgi:hypothetical protein